MNDMTAQNKSGSLNASQSKVFEEIEALLSKSMIQDGEVGQFLAVIGERGLGKTTLLKSFLEKIEGFENFCPAAIVDVSTVPAQVGVMGICIQALFGVAEAQTISKKSASFLEVKEHFEGAFKDAMNIQTEYRRLAQEMAMSPDHFIQMVSKWAKEQQTVDKQFKAFMTALSSLCLKGKGRFCIFLDDLDLGELAMVRAWIRSMVFNYKSCVDVPITWILTFDKKRLLEMISEPTLGTKGTGPPDLTIGRSLLSKLVPFKNQYELDLWKETDKKNFRSFSSGTGTKNLGDLLVKLNQTPFQIMLPSFPRGLEETYSWLSRESKLQTTTAEIKQELLLRKLAEVNGDQGVAQYIREKGAAHASIRIHWHESATISVIDWDFTVEDIRKNRHLSDIPLPEGFLGEVTSEMAPDYLEVLCNLGMAEGSLTPYHLLRRLPFTRDFLSDSQARFPYRNKGTVKMFFRNKHKQLPAAGASLLWGSWQKHDGHWSLHVGPELFWETLSDLRDPFPSEMLSDLHLNQPDLGQNLKKYAEEARGEKGMLPKNFRALLLLVDGLQRAPWQELTTARKFWSPRTVTQCAAAFYLAAMAKELCKEENLRKKLEEHQANPIWLYWPLTPFSKVKSLDDAQINQAFGAMLEVFGKLKYTSAKKTLLGIAHQAQWESFQKLRSTTALSKLEQK